MRRLRIHLKYGLMSAEAGTPPNTPNPGPCPRQNAGPLLFQSLDGTRESQGDNISVPTCFVSMPLGCTDLLW